MQSHPSTAQKIPNITQVLPQKVLEQENLTQQLCLAQEKWHVRMAELIEQDHATHEGLWYAELYVRYLALFYRQHVKERLKGLNKKGREPGIYTGSFTSEQILQKELSKKHYRLNVKKLISKTIATELKKKLAIKGINCKKEDLTKVRLFFKENKPIEDETTLELYFRYDPEGKRKMHLGQFYTLLPKEWKGKYEVINATYADCTQAKKFFEESEPIEDETTLELYFRYDPDGKRKMHLGHFYTLLPKEWKGKYEKIDAPYGDCIQAKKFFEENKPIEDETTLELYFRYDPDGKRKMHLGQFHTLLPKEWKGKYEKIDATYADCIQTKKFFEESEPIEDETTLELYFRYDPEGKRKMHLGQFYTLLPKEWKEEYEVINATYADCIQAKKFFEESEPIEDETTLELYFRYDPEGKRKMNLGHFYTLLPKEWKGKYEVINATYADCIQAKKFFEENKPIEDETTLELYFRYDPEGKRKMYLGHFYTLLPKEWKGKYEKIDATYADCIQAKKFFEESDINQTKQQFPTLPALKDHLITNLNIEFQWNQILYVMPKEWKKVYREMA